MTEIRKEFSLMEKVKQGLIRRAPIVFLPPYGKERWNFRNFLEQLPVGGLGFHFTTGQYLNSILEYGLNPKYFRKSRRPEIHYAYLDAILDPYLLGEPNTVSIIATYHRLKNTIVVLAEYGSAHAKFDIENNDNELLKKPQQPILIVFKNATTIATNLEQDEELKRWEQEKIKRILKDRNFIIPHPYAKSTD